MKGKTGFLDIYLSKKSFKETGHVSNFVPQPKNNLSNKQLSAYNWLVDQSLLSFNDSINKDTFVEMLLAKKCLCFFRVGKIFGVNVRPPISPQLSKIVRSLYLLINELQEKGIINNNYNPELIAGGERKVVLNFIVELHQKAMEGIPCVHKQPTTVTLNDWLIGFGMIPPYGDDWFAETKLFLVEDPLRNGEVLRNLCYVFRPDIYEGVLPPATKQKEMVERNRQALMVFAEEGIIDACDVNYCKDIVMGNINVIVSVLEKIYMFYTKKQQNVVASIKKEIV